ncbi:BZ3500_MvSof-1268-A1-R1_Chr4-2g06910 [Microbotryum saponariae]|uniref:BZ3500_MvSof-1268-A1-R1_Chr4-2g06910 protein n=1 Tax=Microbotryum saponariae TaxID=289078 RepID=A0A2X0LDL1_9BASI|nr:BZ3500_MvSof-1268-A1-R1_Chr4-2g06910 [Microbotryum saponariae]SDA06575.1 BZ3501_MvSof-1269-A2-R1_Chr4-2g06621 [Microbotryum saponariae]
MTTASTSSSSTKRSQTDDVGQTPAEPLESIAPTDSHAAAETADKPSASKVAKVDKHPEHEATEEKQDGLHVEDEDEDEDDSNAIAPSQIANLTKLYEDGILEVVNDGETVHHPCNATHNKIISLWQGDITHLKVDAIVNAANNSLLGGGGVDGAIHRAAGPSLLKECRPLKGCETGRTKITKGHRLPSKHVLHTVGPIYSRNDRQESEELLRGCYKTCLALVKEHALTSVAFSGISTGVYGYPLSEAAQVALDEVRQFLDNDEYGSKANLSPLRPRIAQIKHIVFTNFRQIDVDQCKHLRHVPDYFPPAPSEVQDESKEPEEGA